MTRAISRNCHQCANTSADVQRELPLPFSRMPHVGTCFGQGLLCGVLTELGLRSTLYVMSPSPLCEQRLKRYLFVQYLTVR